MMKGPNAPPEIKYPESMPIAGEPFRGEANAPVAIIEYGDFECPFCRRFEHNTYPQLIDTYIKTGNVKYLHRDLPLPFHEHAMPAAEAVRCPGAQGKCWPMYDSLFLEQVPETETEVDDRARKLGVDMGKFNACVTAKQFATPIQHQIDDAQKMNIGGTPTFQSGL